MNHPLRLVLLLLAAAPVSAPAEPSVNGLPFADEYVWRSDYYAEWVGDLGYMEMARQVVFQTEQATDLMQGVLADEDHACPVRFAHRRILPFVAAMPEFETIQDISFRIAPGVYLYPANRGSIALTPGDKAKVAAGAKFARRGGWTLAHEIGHNAGLDHDPHSLMSGAGPADAGQTVTAVQCEAFMAGAVLEGTARCLLFDAALASQGAWPYVPAPAFTACSDGSGYCDSRGRCNSTRPQCANETGLARAGTDCSAQGFCGACSGASGRCLPCDTETGRTDVGVCGNGIQDAGEACDDGNYYAGDGCDAQCNVAQIAPEFETDRDGDGLPDYRDRCPALAIPDQRDVDGDGMGDRCDRCPFERLFDSTVPCEGEADEDGDGVSNLLDNCPGIYATSTSSADGDYVGDACDNCRIMPNSGQVDRNGDGVGDACQCGDATRDGYLNASDVGCLVGCVLGSSTENCYCGAEWSDTQNDGQLTFDDALRLSAVVRGQLSAHELSCRVRPQD